MSILVLTSDTLIGTPATGNLEYNGQFFGTDSNASRAQMQRLVLSTAVPYTSFTTTTYNDFLNIPAWAKRITVMFSGLSTSGSNYLRVQIGAGSIETSGYQSSSNVQSAAAGNSIASTSSAGFDLYSNASGNTVYGALYIQLVGSNQWVVSGNFSTTTTGVYAGIGGGKTTSGTLDRVRITTVGSTDTFDAGTVNILYEG